MKYRIHFDQANCLGCGACTMCDNWKRTPEGGVMPIKTEIDELGCNEQAAQICPARVIRIEEIQ
jgi:ferredoxin